MNDTDEKAHKAKTRGAGYYGKNQEMWYFASMEAAAGAMGISKSILQTAKADGCPAFRDTRVYALDFLRWLFKKAESDEVVDWGKASKKIETQLKAVELDIKLGKLRKASEVEEQLRNLSAIFYGALRRLRLECPRDFEMRPKEYIKNAMDEKHSQIINQLRSLIQQKVEADAAHP